MPGRYLNGVFWFGVVENRMDPLQLGRCQVRIMGLHNPDKTQLPIDDLPWAYPMTPITSAAISGLGWSPTGLVEGSWVVIIFKDEHYQQPIMIGSVGGVPIEKGSVQSQNSQIAALGQTLGTNTPLNTTPGNFSGSTNAEKAYNFFISKGYTPEQSAGIVGNLMAESGQQLNTGAIGDSGRAFGIAQWHPDRQAGLRNYAARSGGNPNSLETQLEWVDLEIRGQDAAYNGGHRNGGTGTYAALKAATTVDEATHVIQARYERCAACGGGFVLADRRRNAQGVFRTYGEGTPVTPSNEGFQDPNGVYPKYTGEPDTSREARNEKLAETAVEDRISRTTVSAPIANNPGKWNQPTSPYNARYPYNHVYHSESGHILEFDDTKQAERINLYHKAGTFFEIDSNGSQVNKIVGNGYEIIDNDGYIAISGNCILAVGKDVSIAVTGKTSIQLDGEANIYAKAALNIKSDKNISLQTSKDIDVKCQDFTISCNQFNIDAESSVEMKSDLIAGDAPKIAWNGGQANPGEADPKFNTFVPSLKEFPQTNREQEKHAALEDPSHFPPGSSRPDLTNTIADTTPTNLNTNFTAVDCDESTATGTTQLSSSVTLHEMTRSPAGGNVRAQHNLTDAQIMCNLRHISTNVIDKVKEKYPNAYVTSGYRRAGVEGVSLTNGNTSQHELGEAVDISFPGATQEELFAIAQDLKNTVPYDQMILEYTDQGNWIHFSSTPRQQRGHIYTMLGSNTPLVSGLRRPT